MIVFDPMLLWRDSRCSFGRFVQGFQSTWWWFRGIIVVGFRGWSSGRAKEKRRHSFVVDQKMNNLIIEDLTHWVTSLYASITNSYYSWYCPRSISHENWSPFKINCDKSVDIAYLRPPRRRDRIKNTIPPAPVRCHHTAAVSPTHQPRKEIWISRIPAGIVPFIRSPPPQHTRLSDWSLMFTVIEVHISGTNPEECFNESRIF